MEKSIDESLFLGTACHVPTIFKGQGSAMTARVRHDYMLLLYTESNKIVKGVARPLEPSKRKSFATINKGTLFKMLARILAASLVVFL